MPTFEWDEAKRLRVLAERELDLRDAAELFDGRAIVHVSSRRYGEDRVVSTAEWHGKLYSVVWVWRDENQRLITFRRAHNAEESKYRQIYG